MKNKDTIISWLLRIGIAAVLLYASVAATLHPNDWIGFLPPFVTHIAPAATMLKLFSLGQAVLAIWLLTGWQLFYAAVLSCLLLAGIIFANLGALDVTFRDISILLSAIALAVLAKE